MTVESNHAIALVLVFSVTPIACKKNSKELLDQLDTSKY